MRLAKFICWTIIGIFYALIGYVFYLLFELLERHSGLFQVVFIGIGFIFVWYQIKIARNKDIFIKVQDDLENEVNFYFERNKDFYIDVFDLIDNYFIEPPTKNIKNDFLYTGFHAEKELEQPFFDELNGIVKKYQLKTLPNFIVLYRWWLGDFYNELKRIRESNSYVNVTDFIKKIRNKIKNKQNKGKINRVYLKEQIEKEFIYNVEDLESLTTDLEKFFLELAKDKGVS